jgi:hypothetical protein
MIERLAFVPVAAAVLLGSAWESGNGNIVHGIEGWVGYHPDRAPTRHCQYVTSKDTNPNSPFYGMNRGGWVCKTY